MTATATRRPRLAPLVSLAGVLALAAASQLSGLLPQAPAAGLEEPMLAAAPPAETLDESPGRTAGDDTAAARDGGTAPVPAVVPDAAPADEELARIRADIDFWGGRLTGAPGDVVAAVKLAESDVAEARLTGDVTAYQRAEAAADAALDAQPAYLPAQDMRASVLVALHRFAEARDLANQVIDRAPGDTTALGVLGDASLELGDLDTAGRAYGELGVVADGSSARVRAGRLAFVMGALADAVTRTRAAADAALDEGLEGDALAFYRATLGEMLLATGDAAGALDAFRAALDARPGLPAALVGLAKLDAFEGDLDGAIDRLDAAIAAIPLPDTLARRADLLDLRDGPGDAERAATDRATVEVVAQLAGDAATVYDRGLSVYLSDHGLEPERAVRLATDELAIRRDVYGYDALAWALLNAGRAADAATPMTSALAAGTRDARLWYHAGLIAAANGDGASARGYLRDALALGPALDPVARARATAALETIR